MSAMSESAGHRALAVVVTAFVVVGSACGGGRAHGTSEGPAVPCGGHTTAQYSHHDGVPAALNSLDVYRPAADGRGRCTGRPLVVWIHGGGWTAGDKADDIQHKVQLFTDAGYVFSSINYRLTDITTVPPHPRYPVHNQDSAAAVAWLVEHAGDLGIDTDRVAVLGHSAGGGITAAITTDESYLAAHALGLDSIRCAGSIDGEGYDVVAGATDPDPSVHTTYLNIFGTDPAVWPAASPVRHVRPDAGIPDYFVAARGVENRLDMHVEFVTALREAGVPVTVVDARSLDHAEVSLDIGTPGDTVVTPALTTFLDGCFNPATRSSRKSG